MEKDSLQISRENVKARIEAKKKSPNLTKTAAIRCFCIECSGFQPSEVRNCPVVNCALYNFRMGYSRGSKQNAKDTQNV